LEIGNWKLEIGNWKLEIGNWKIPNFQFPDFQHLTTMQLVLETHGLKLSVRNRSFLVEGKEGKRLISPQMIDSIALHANVLLTSDVVELAIGSGIPILFFDRLGNPLGRTWSLRFESHPLLRRNQVLFERDAANALPWALLLYRMKTAGQLENIAGAAGLDEAQQNIRQFLTQLEALKPQPGHPLEAVIMGIEGAAARAYWAALATLVPEGFRFEGRSRQPAQDFFNCALNYAYGMLYNVVESAIFSAGLDPYLGIVHADEYNRPALCFDLIEPFRPWFDRLIVQLCNDSRLEPAHFDPLEKKDGGGWRFNKPGKQVLIPAFTGFLKEAVEWQGKSLSRKNHIYQFAGEFAALLKEYKPK
jgi:CRISPR-associated protein Cas1